MGAIRKQWNQRGYCQRLTHCNSRAKENDILSLAHTIKPLLSDFEKICHSPILPHTKLDGILRGLSF